MTSGSRRRPSPSTCTIVFWSKQKLRLGLHLELLGDLEELREKAGERDLLQRLAEDRLADRTAGLGEGVDRPARRHVARGEVDFRHAAVVAGKKAEQHIREEEAGRAVEPAHDAEIDNDDRARRVDEHVSGMEIGMKEAVAEHLVEKGAGCLDQ